MASEEVAKGQAQLNQLRGQLDAVRHSIDGKPPKDSEVAQLRGTVGKLMNLMEEYDRVVTRYERQLRHLLLSRQQPTPNLDEKENGQARMKNNQQQIERQLSIQQTLCQELVEEKARLVRDLAEAKSMGDPNMKQQISLLTIQLGQAIEEATRAKQERESLEIELRTMVDQMTSMRSEKARVQAEDRVLQTRLAELGGKDEQNAKLIQELRQELLESESRMRKALRARDLVIEEYKVRQEAPNDASQMNEKVETLYQNRLDQLTGELEQLGMEKIGLAERLQQATEAMEVHRRNYERLTQEHERSILEHSKALADLSEDRSRQAEEVKKLRNQNNLLRAQLSNAEEQAANNGRLYREALAHEGSADSQLRSLTEERDRLWATNEDLRRMIKDRDTAIAEMRSKIDSVRQTVQGQLEGRLDEAQRRERVLEERLSHLQTALHMAQAELAGREEEVKAAESEILSLAQQVEDERERAEGERSGLERGKGYLERRMAMLEHEKELLILEIERLSGQKQSEDAQEETVEDEEYQKRLRDIRNRMQSLERRYGGPEALGRMFAKLHQLTKHSANGWESPGSSLLGKTHESSTISQWESTGSSLLGKTHEPKESLTFSPTSKESSTISSTSSFSSTASSSSSTSTRPVSRQTTQSLLSLDSSDYAYLREHGIVDDSPLGCYICGMKGHEPYECHEAQSSVDSINLSLS